MKKYKYIGSGAGIPGLPHEITDDEAKTLGVEDILREAIKNGSYIEVNDSPATAPRRSRGSAQDGSEVNNG